MSVSYSGQNQDMNNPNLVNSNFLNLFYQTIINIDADLQLVYTKSNYLKHNVELFVKEHVTFRPVLHHVELPVAAEHLHASKHDAVVPEFKSVGIWPSSVEEPSNAELAEPRCTAWDVRPSPTAYA